MLYWIAGIVFALFVGLVAMFLLTRKEIEMLEDRILESDKTIQRSKEFLEDVQDCLDE